MIDKLKDNGFMKLGLYSEIARQDVIQAREYIKSKKLDQNERDLKAIDTNTGIASVFLLVALAFLLSRVIIHTQKVHSSETYYLSSHLKSLFM